MGLSPLPLSLDILFYLSRSEFQLFSPPFHWKLGTELPTTSLILNVIPCEVSAVLHCWCLFPISIALSLLGVL